MSLETLATPASTASAVTEQAAASVPNAPMEPPPSGLRRFTGLKVSVDESSIAAVAPTELGANPHGLVELGAVLRQIVLRDELLVHELAKGA